MINVRTWDMPDGGVGIELSGHAGDKHELPPANAVEAHERTQVCSGASMLLVTLASMTNGTWQGNQSGCVVCLVPPAMLAHLEFVIVGLMLLQAAYAGHMVMDKQDTRVGVEWRKAAEWADKHTVKDD